jgi:hypothetical protein
MLARYSLTKIANTVFVVVGLGRKWELSAVVGSISMRLALEFKP